MPSIASQLHLARPLPYQNSHYTYFIVPFTYRLQGTEGSTAGVLRYVPDDEHGIHIETVDGERELEDSRFRPDARRLGRDRYLLPEARISLFNRAKWFRLRADDPDALWEGEIKFNTGSNEKPCIETLRFNAGPIEVVLFEWERSSERATNERNAEDVGMLLVPVVLEPDLQGGAVSLANLLDFNERFRYIDLPTWDKAQSDLAFRLKGDVKEEYTYTGKAAEVSRYWPFWTSLLRYPFHVDGRTFRLQVDGYSDWERLKWDVSPKHSRGIDGSPAYPDDRAFVLTFACVEGLPEFKGLPSRQTGQAQGWESQWYALLDVDNREKLDSELSPTELDWLHARSYERWLGWGTAYGYTDFSNAMLVRKMERNFADAYYHLHTHYLDFLLLLLYQRVRLLRLSYLFTLASGREKQKQGELRELRRHYTSLINLYRFPVITTQYQGQELFELAVQSLRLDHLYEQVGAQVAASDALVTQDSDEEIENRLYQLQVVGFEVALVVLLMTFVTLVIAVFAFIEALYPDGHRWMKWLHTDWVIAVLLVTLPLLLVASVWVLRSARKARGDA